MHQHVPSFPPDKPSKGRSRYAYWTTRAGVKMRLEDMTLSHLINSIAMMERHAENVHPISLWGLWIDDIDFPDDVDLSCDLPQAYHDMVNELERREKEEHVKSN